MIDKLYAIVEELELASANPYLSEAQAKIKESIVQIEAYRSEQNSADIILQCIEKVDPLDQFALTRIDYRVNLYLSGLKIPYNDQWIRARERYGDCPAYTRCRNALKVNRPKSFTYVSEQSQKETEGYDGWIVKLGAIATSKLLPTEELAELHAIIQAIEFERKRKQQF